MKYIFRPLRDLEDRHIDALASMGYTRANKYAMDVHYLLAYVDELFTDLEIVMTFPHILTTCDKDSILGIAKRNDYTPIATIEEFLTYFVISREAATQYLHNL